MTWKFVSYLPQMFFVGFSAYSRSAVSVMLHLLAKKLLPTALQNGTYIGVKKCNRETEHVCLTEGLFLRYWLGMNQISFTLLAFNHLLRDTLSLRRIKLKFYLHWASPHFWFFMEVPTGLPNPNPDLLAPFKPKILKILPEHFLKDVYVPISYRTHCELRLTQK